MALPNYSGRNNHRNAPSHNPKARRRLDQARSGITYPPSTTQSGPAASVPYTPAKTYLPGEAGYPGPAGGQASAQTASVDWTQPLSSASAPAQITAATSPTPAATAPAATSQNSAIYQPATAPVGTAPTPAATSQNSPIYQPPQAQTYPSTPPVQTEAHPFFDPNSNYWQPGTGQPAPSNIFQQPNTELHRTWANQNPEGYYYAILNQRGLGGFDARSQTAQSMYRDVMTGYQAAKMNNAELDLSDYMQMFDLDSLLNQMTNEQLGMDETRFRGRNRWGMRAV